MDEWREWMIQTFTEDKSNFVTAERNADGWNFNRFTSNPFTKEIARLQAELEQARKVPVDIVKYVRSANLKLIATAIESRWVKSPKPPIL